MRIYFERSGGFMGLEIKAAVDTAVLPVTEATYLESMVQETHFFELPEALTDDNIPDQMAYTVTVETEEQQHTVYTTDVMAPEELRPLLRRLTRLARQQPPEPPAEQTVDCP